MDPETLRQIQLLVQIRNALQQARLNRERLELEERRLRDLSALRQLQTLSLLTQRALAERKALEQLRERQQTRQLVAGLIPSLGKPEFTGRLAEVGGGLDPNIIVSLLAASRAAEAVQRREVPEPLRRVELAGEILGREVPPELKAASLLGVPALTELEASRFLMGQGSESSPLEEFLSKQITLP